jgi:hypothetical protein
MIYERYHIKVEDFNINRIPILLRKLFYNILPKF